MNPLHGVLLDAGSLGLGDLDWQELKDSFDTLSVYPFTEPHQLGERIASADIVLTNKTVITAEAIQAAPQLKQIIILATGTNNVDLEAARAAGITVSNNRDYSTHSLVEHTITLILALARRLPAYLKRIENGDWQRSQQFCLLEPIVSGLNGSRLGIIGLGASGLGLARVASALGMDVVALESARAGTAPQHIPRLPLSALLASVDVLSIHCPLNEQTRGLIDRNALRLMKPSALLVNTARGGIVVEPDLVEALEQGWIAGAATDVLSTEPPATGNVLLDCRHPNLIITPHNAWGSVSSRQALIDQTTRIVQAFRRGEIIHCVNG